MSNEVVIAEKRQLTAADMRSHVNMVQEVMRAVMISDMHYGVIPGTKKPSLYKAGAEVLCAAFRIADKYDIEDLSVDGAARFRVRCMGVHQVTGITLGEGMGECSSHEEKYKWRAAICQEEFDGTPENMKRIKYAKWNNKVEKKQQVRTEPADAANTVLKMACKRAKIAMTLNVTAASDIFTQDIEDLPPELQEREDNRKAEAGETKPERESWTQAAFDAALKKYSPTITSGEKAASDLLAWMDKKAALTDTQKSAVLALKKAEPKPIEGTVMTEEEIAAARAREMEEGATA